MIRHTSDWQEFVSADWRDSIMSVPVTDHYHAKQGRSVGRLMLQTSNGQSLTVYLKRHFELPWWRGMLARLFPGKAWSPGLEEWEHLEWATREGFQVPRAVAAGEFRGPRCKLQSFLAIEELTDQLGLHEAVPLAHSRLNAEEFARWKRGLIVELARLSRELHKRRTFHKDLYFCHFYIAEADTKSTPESWRGRVSMIDLHRMSRQRLGWQWYVIKDLAQLLFSSDEAGVTARDRLRFWKYYREGDWGRATRPGGLIHWGVLVKWKRYVEHNKKLVRGMPKVEAS